MFFNNYATLTLFNQYSGNPRPWVFLRSMAPTTDN